MQKLPTLSRAGFQAYDLLSLPVWLFSLETLQIQASNQAAQAMLGYDAQTLQSMTIADVRPQEDRVRIFDEVKKFRGARADAGIWTIVAENGDRHTVSFNWQRVLFEDTVAIVATIRDMTRTVQAEAKAEALDVELAAWRRSETVSSEHLSHLFDTLPGKMLVLTPDDDKIVAVTDELAQAVMRDRGMLLNRPLFDVFRNDPDEPNADGVQKLRASLQRVKSLRVMDVMNIQRYPVRQIASKRLDAKFEEIEFEEIDLDESQRQLEELVSQFTAA